MSSVVLDGSGPRQLVLFCAAAALNTAFGYGAFALGKWAGMPNDLAVVCSTIAGVMFNFGTFRAAFSGSGMSRLPHFVLFYAANLSINIALLRAFTARGLSPYLGEALTIIIIAPFAFVAMRHFVFPAAVEPRV